MKIRSMISTKDHYIIVGDIFGIGEELASGTELEGVANGVKVKISCISFKSEGCLQLFKGGESNWQKLYEEIPAPSLATLGGGAYELGSCSTTEHTRVYSVWPKWGEVGKRITFGMYLAGEKDLEEIKKDPDKGRILSETCTRNVYRDLENFEYVSKSKYNE